MARPFFLVDVFTQRALAGNQLAVVTDSEGLSSRQMQQIAREFNFSETTFLMPQRNGHPRRLRIFTPVAELPFAGHPTLGSAHVLRTELSRRAPMNIALELGVGVVPVAFEPGRDGGRYWMRQPSAVFGRTAPRAAAAAAIGLKPSDLSADHPVQEVSTGLPTLIVPVGSRAALDRCQLDKSRLGRLLERRESRSLLAFATEASRGHAVSVRVFVPGLGVTEDAATGSSNGCLAAYLARHRCLGDSRVDVRAEQGWGMGRPSTLHLRATEMDDSVDVRVGGGCVTIARGELA